MFRLAKKSRFFLGIGWLVHLQLASGATPLEARHYLPLQVPEEQEEKDSTLQQRGGRHGSQCNGVSVNVKSTFPVQLNFQFGQIFH